jgi:hypothetical protein
MLREEACTALDHRNSYLRCAKGDVTEVLAKTMEEMKKDLPAGSRLDRAFCRWHNSLLQADLFAPCRPESCPLQQTMEKTGRCDDPARIFLDENISLADLVRSVGKERWNLLRNSPDTIRHHLEELKNGAMAAQEFSGHALGIFSPAARCAAPEQRGLAAASELLIGRHILSARYAGLEEETEEALHDLLTHMAPSNAQQGSAMCDFLHWHFLGMHFLARRGQSPPQEVAALEDQALECFDLSMESLDLLGKLISQSAWASSGAHAPTSTLDPVFQATAARTSREAELISCPLIEAMRPLVLPGNWTDGVFALLADAAPREPVEALVRTQLILFQLKALSPPPADGPLSGEPEQHKRVTRLGKTSLKLQKALALWIERRDAKRRVSAPL